MTVSPRRRVRPLQQTSETDCASTCLAMIADYHRVDTTLAEIRDALDPGRDGVTAYRLKQAAPDLGLQIRAFKVTADEILRGELVIESPCIAHWDRDHYVVLEPGRNRRSVAIVDPAVGRRRLSPDRFRAGMSSGVVLGVEPDPETSRGVARALRASLWSVMAPLLQRHRAFIAALILITAVLTGGGLLSAWAGAEIIRDFELDRSPIWWVLLVGLSVPLVVMLAIVRGVANAGLQSRFTAELGIVTARQLFGRSWQYFERRSLGDLLGRVNSASAIHQLVGGIVLTALLDAVLAVGCVVVLAVFDLRLALVSGLIIAGLTIVSGAVATRSATLQREELLASADADSLMVDALSGLASLRANAAERLVLDRWETIFERTVRLGSTQTALAGVVAAIELSLQFGLPILLLALALEGGHSLATAVGLSTVAAVATSPLGRLAASLLSLAEIRPLLERLIDLRDAKAAPAGTEVAPELVGRITVAGAGFQYDRYAPWALTNITLDVPAGSKVGILGPSGCGKSTLVSLLTGLHSPTTGTVSYDGIDLAVTDPVTVRRQLGVVLQTNWLGRGTLREVVDMGRDLDDATIRQALEVAGLGADLRATPLGLDTRLTEGQGGWSAGQRQRLALARALAGGPRVLILDEATSALDVINEAEIETNLRDLSITRVVIAHRLSTVADADQIVVLDGGRIVEQGSPRELVAREGRYAAMLRADTNRAQHNLAVPAEV